MESSKFKKMNNFQIKRMLPASDFQNNSPMLEMLELGSGLNDPFSQHILEKLNLRAKQSVKNHRLKEMICLQEMYGDIQSDKLQVFPGFALSFLFLSLECCFCRLWV